MHTSTKLIMTTRVMSSSTGTVARGGVIYFAGVADRCCLIGIARADSAGTFVFREGFRNEENLTFHLPPLPSPANNTPLYTKQPVMFTARWGQVTRGQTSQTLPIQSSMFNSKGSERSKEELTQGHDWSPAELP